MYKHSKGKIGSYFSPDGIALELYFQMFLNLGTKCQSPLLKKNCGSFM